MVIVYNLLRNCNCEISLHYFVIWYIVHVEIHQGKKDLIIIDQLWLLLQQIQLISSMFRDPSNFFRIVKILQYVEHDYLLVKCTNHVE